VCIWNICLYLMIKVLCCSLSKFANEPCVSDDFRLQEYD